MLFLYSRICGQSPGLDVSNWIINVTTFFAPDEFVVLSTTLKDALIQLLQKKLRYNCNKKVTMLMLHFSDRISSSQMLHHRWLKEIFEN